MHTDQESENAGAVAIGQGAKGWQFAVLSGILGWILDSFDFFVVVFLFDTLAQHFHVSKAAVIYTLTITLAARPLGALAFGAAADRFGRKVPLIVCVLYFSCVTVLSVLSPNFTCFVVMRALYGFGMGGYWGIGASYAMESAPIRLRGMLSGVMQSGYPAGYLCAALAMATVARVYGWKSVFFVGVPVAILTAICAFVAPESQSWKTQGKTSLSEMARSLGRFKGRFVYLLFLMAMMLCLSHGTLDLYPDFLRSIPAVRGQVLLGMNVVFAAPILFNVAAVCGSILCGVASQRIGRRRAAMIALFLSLMSIWPWAFGNSVIVLTLGACLMQFGDQGALGVIPAHLNELSPSPVRGLFPGLVYQLGVLVAAPATAIELKLQNLIGYPWALTAFNGVVILALISIFYFGPEEHGKDFAS